MSLRTADALIDEAHGFPAAHAVGVRERLADLVPAGVALVAVVAVCAPQGSFFPTAWGWVALPFCWVAIVGLTIPRVVELSVRELATVGLFTLFTGWVALSTVWSAAVPETVLEIERDLIYPVALAALLLVTRAGRSAAILGGTLAGVTGVAAYALGTRLLQGVVSESVIAGLRLSTPIGYWNGLGIICVVAALVALGFAAHGRSTLARALAAACVPTLVLAVYFTFSRGSWVALGAGLIVAVAVDAGRLRLLVTLLALAAWPAIAIILAVHERALTTTASTITSARHEGHRLALVLLLLTAAAAVASVVVGVIDRRWSPSAAARRAFAGTAAATVLVVLVAVFAAYGSPWAIAHRAYRSFTGAALVTHTANYNLNKRLLSLSSNGRIAVWHVAARQAKAHPVVGDGAGTYGSYFLRHRKNRLSVQDAHSLYLEQVAEVGVVGFVLLVAALLVPVAAALRVRRSPLVGATLGAYAAFLVHQGYDWDWELPGVTLTGLLGGGSLLVAARPLAARRVGPASRWAAGAALVAVAAFAFVGLVGNRYLAQSNDATAAGHFATALGKAKKASTWAPWSAEAWQARGLAQVKLGERAAGLASLRIAVRKDPANATLWGTLAAYAPAGEAARARREFARLDPLAANGSH